MVATRRGVRVISPSKTNPDQSSDVPATPSTGRRTRNSVKQAESSTQQALLDTCSQLQKSEASPPPSLKRCARASRLHSPEQPCTPAGSTHEADVSDVESMCSVVSDIESLTTRVRRRKQPPAASQEDEEVSEVESCSSAVSASRARRSSRRSTRRMAISESSDPAPVEAEDAKSVSIVEAESGSSVSESRRVTRSQRKPARNRSSFKQQTEESEVSDGDSYMSSTSEISKSTSRRATRSRRQTGPIPIHLDEASEGSLSPASTGRRTRSARGKATASVTVSEPQSCDSDGFESGPSSISETHRQRKMKSVDSDSELTVGSLAPAPAGLRTRSARGKATASVTVSEPLSCDSDGFESGPSSVTRNLRRRKPKTVDSDSDLTDGHSQRGTPSSSRTGSGNSSQRASLARSSIKNLRIVLNKAEETSLNDSRLESTVIAEDADCTLLEEEESQTVEEKQEGALSSAEGDASRAEKVVKVIAEEDVSDIPACAEAAVTVRRQQEELCDESKDEDASEMEKMQETTRSSEALEPGPAVTAAACERPETTEDTEDKDEAMETADVDTHPSQADERDVEETRPSEEERMEVGLLDSDAQQVVDSSEVKVESIQVASVQQQSVTVESSPEQPPEDVLVQKTKTTSLLESSEDEEEEEEEEEDEEVSEEEGDEAEEKAGPSNQCEAAGSPVDGLFMIDTRPGQEADEVYYMEKEQEEEEKDTKEEAVQQEEEEFVDEEGEEDEDANVLFSSRNPLLKEMSSRIDPGLRVKELGGLYINFDGSKSKPVSSSLQKLKEKKIQDQVMKKSVIGPDFEKKDAVPPYSESKQAVKLKHRVEREKSTGDAWFNMKAPEMTRELKGDLQVLKMRGSLDPKRFYKKNDRDGFPKYFQVGTVVDNPMDFYHSRVPNKSRKRTMVEELLADAEFRQNNKKKYQQIMTEKAAHGAGRRNNNKKKNKFHKK